MKKLQSKLISSSSPIQCILIPENETVKKVEAGLQKNGLNIRAIMHPTVEKGKERIRICIHSFNSEKNKNVCIKFRKTNYMKIYFITGIGTEVGKTIASAIVTQAIKADSGNQFKQAIKL